MSDEGGDGEDGQHHPENRKSRISEVKVQQIDSDDEVDRNREQLGQIKHEIVDLVGVDADEVADLAGGVLFSGSRTQEEQLPHHAGQKRRPSPSRRQKQKIERIAVQSSHQDVQNGVAKSEEDAVPKRIVVAMETGVCDEVKEPREDDRLQPDGGAVERFQDQGNGQMEPARLPDQRDEVGATQGGAVVEVLFDGGRAERGAKWIEMLKRDFGFDSQPQELLHPEEGDLGEDVA